MSGLTDSVALLNRLIDRRVSRVAPFRAVVTDVDGDLIEIRRIEATSPESRKVASCGHIVLQVDDEVLCVNINGEPVVVNRIGRAVAATPTYTLAAAAGNTATALIVGDDRHGVLQITPGGTGITTGSLITITFAHAFATANLAFVMTPASSAARSLGMVLGTSTKTTTTILIATSVALTSGSTYQWNYQNEEHPA